MVAEREGGDEDRSREEAERKKWGQDGKSNVYEDLEILERAIRLENAEFKLKKEILQEKVDFIDQSKRDVIPDVVRFVFVPLAYAFGLFKMASSSRQVLRTISRSATKVMDIHFWTFVVWAPILLNISKRILKSPPDPISEEVAGIDIASLRTWGSSAFEWDDPNKNCDDNVLFLTEYWTSAVNGMFYLQLFRIAAVAIARKATGKGLDSVLQSNPVMLWLSFAQALTRIGAVVSVYQYPEKMYDFERADLDRPVGFFPYLMWKLLRVMMVLAPLGLISDCSKVLLYLPKGSIYPLYGSIAVALYGTWARMKESISNKKDPLSPTRLRPPKPLAKIVYGLSYFAIWRKQLRLLGVGNRFKILMGKLFDSFYSVFWKSLGYSFLLPLPLLGPLVHLKAFKKIFEVEYASDLPSLSSAETYKKTVDENPERAYNMAWRYNLRWRPPQRLAASKAYVYNEIIYRCFVKGTQVDILEQLSAPEFDDQAFERSLKRKPSKDRENWKARAMEFQAKKHKANFESGKMDDPLGVAVWRCFGIGLGFNFEHLRELKEGEEPSPRRLQARAAKSAVRRYSELRKEEEDLIKQNESLDPEERNDEAVKEMKQKIDKELAYIAGRLTELIPTTSNLDEFGVMEVAKFKMKQEPQYRKVSENEIQILEEDPMEYDKGLVNSEMLLNNIQSRRYDSSKSYKKLLDNEEGGKKGEKDSGANDARKDGDDSSSDGEEDDDSTDGLIDIQYV